MSGDEEMLLSFSNMHATSTLILVCKSWLHYFEAGTRGGVFLCVICALFVILRCIAAVGGGNAPF
jgi:hypothetical protein